MKYLIWSWRKKAWWQWERAGYTTELHKAGEYTRKQACEIVLDALPGQNVPVDIELVNNNRDKFEDARTTAEVIDSWRDY